MQPADSSVRLPPRRAGWVFVAGAALVILSSSAAAGFAVWRGYVDALNDWRLFLSNLSNVAAQHADQTVAAADAVLKRVVAHVQDARPQDAADLRRIASGEAMFRFIDERRRELPQIDVVTLVAGDGDVLNFSRSFPPPAINVADRDYFMAHRGDAALAVYLSEPVRNRGNGRWTFYLARKLTDAQGRMIGLALIGIESAYFERFYGSVEPHQGEITMALLRRDGVLLARHPHTEAHMGRALRDSASFRLLQAAGDGMPATDVSRAPRATDPSDRQLRVVAPRVSRAFPLFVSSIANETLMLAQWRRTAWWIGGLSLCLDLLVAGMAVWIFIQVRRRHRAMEQLDRARATAEEASRAKSEFLANMSHEIRTPMNGVLGMTELLLHSGLPERERGFAQAAHRSGQAMLQLLNDLLEVTRAGAGNDGQRLADFDLRILARQQLDLMKSAADQKGLRLVLRLDEALPPLLRGDERRLRQVLLHLLGNAVKFTRQGEVGLEIDHLVRVEGRHRVRICVRDTGVGMSPDTLGRLFQPFEQGDGSMAREHAGRGIGLALTRQWLDRMGGSISVESEEGHGTVFVVHLSLDSVN